MPKLSGFGPVGGGRLQVAPSGAIYDPANPFTPRTALTLVGIGLVLVLVGDRFPAWAYGTLVLVLLYLALTNAALVGRTVDYLTNPHAPSVF